MLERRMKIDRVTLNDPWIGGSVKLFMIAALQPLSRSILLYISVYIYMYADIDNKFYW